MTINELREARNKAWQGAKAFVESKRDKDGLLSAEDAAAYADMEKKIKDYSAEIERMEQMEAMDNYIITQFGKALANAEEDAFLNGDGSGKPTGLFAATGGGTVAGTLSAAIKSDDMLDLVYALKRPYRKNASFIMNDKTLAQLRKLKDNNGAYIWQPSYQAGEPDKVLGYAVHTSAYAPENAIAFGDYSYYNIGDRGTRSFKQLNELFAGNGMIGYVAKERVDGKLILPEAVQILKLKADATA